MTQNIYDDPQFFEGYGRLPRSVAGLDGAPEWPALRALLPDLTVQALAPNLRGAQNAYNGGVHKISMPISVSEGHSRANLNRTPAESIVMMREVMDWLKSQDRKVPVVAGASTASLGLAISKPASPARAARSIRGRAR